MVLAAMLSCSLQERKPKLPFYNGPDFNAEWISASDRRYDSIHTIDAFSFVNQDGRKISNYDVAGKIYVANFFFTTCTGICPKMIAQLKKVEAAFEADTNVLILSHSVLPETDSVSRLSEYGRRMEIPSEKWWLLTGNKQTVYALARRSYFADEEIGYNKASDEFLHTENSILIDRKGRIRGVYNSTLELEMDKLIEHIRILKQESDN
jgi:protein SCO1